MNADKDFILASARLARRAPDEWMKFLDTLTSYTEEKVIECIQAPIEMVPVAQGRAQAVLKLRQLMEDCVKKADDIVSRVPPSAKKP